jgi:hypothetical protein
MAVALVASEHGEQRRVADCGRERDHRARIAQPTHQLIVASGWRGVDRCGFRQRFGSPHLRKRMQPAIEGVDPSQVRARDVDRRHAAGPHLLGDHQRRPAGPQQDL